MRKDLLISFAILSLLMILPMISLTYGNKAVAEGPTIGINIPGTGNFVIDITNDGGEDFNVAMTSYRWLQATPDDTQVITMGGTVDVPSGTTRPVALPAFIVGPGAHPGKYPIEIMWTVQGTGEILYTTAEVDLMYSGASVGGIMVPVDKFVLLAPYIGLGSTTMIGAVATVVYVKRVKRRKEKQ